MNRNNNAAILALANTYMAFHIHDFVHQVLGNIKGSHAIPSEMVSELIKDKTEIVGLESLSINNSNTHSRFLIECAEFALQNNLEDAASREVWDQIKDLPSAHHNELNQIAFVSAELYRTTVDETLVNTIARDASTTAQLITATAQSRTKNEETGGSFNLFSWGILNDGLWLNNALLKAHDRANIFKPDTTPNSNWVNEAFNFADHSAAFETLYGDQRLTGEADLNLLFGTLDEDRFAQYLDVVSQSDLNKFVFSSGQAKMQIEDWKAARNNPNNLMDAVVELTAYARLIDMLVEASNTQNDDVSLDDSTRVYLQRAQDVVTLVLAGYEAMRETRFADTLIMSVKSQTEDPTVDVFVNGDVYPQFKMTHGSDEDIVVFSHSLDPRKGMPVSSNGWSLAYYTERQEKVLPEMLAKSADRLETLRANDARMIREYTQDLVSNSVMSYLNARGVDEMTPVLKRQVSVLSNAVVDNKSSIQLDRELTKIFTAAMDNDFVSQASDLLLTNLDENSQVKGYAKAATIAQLAFKDAVELLTQPAASAD